MRLTAKISNIGPVPLPNARCHLSFEPPPKHRRQIAEDEISWTFVSGHVKQEGEGEGSNIASLFDNPLTLQPSTQYIQVVDIKSKAPMQYNGILEINFSAMDEQPIQEKHRFGIYLLDQVSAYTLGSEDQGLMCVCLIDAEITGCRNTDGCHCSSVLLALVFTSHSRD